MAGKPDLLRPDVLRGRVVSVAMQSEAPKYSNKMNLQVFVDAFPVFYPTAYSPNFYSLSVPMG